MVTYKQVILGSLATLAFIGCGGNGPILEIKTDGTLIPETTTSQTSEDNETGITLIQPENNESISTDNDRYLSNQEMVYEDCKALTLPKYINKEYALPIEGVYDSDIYWSLINKGDFNITNHTLMIENKNIKQYAKLSALISSDMNSSTAEANKTKEFCITILPEAVTDMEKVMQDIKMVQGNDFPLIIDLNSTQPYANSDLMDHSPYNDSNISWKICDTDLLEINTTTNRLQVINPEAIMEKTKTELKGTFQYGETEEVGYFPVIILPVEAPSK